MDIKSNIIDMFNQSISDRHIITIKRNLKKTLYDNISKNEIIRTYSDLGIELIEINKHLHKKQIKFKRANETFIKFNNVIIFHSEDFNDGKKITFIDLPSIEKAIDRLS